MYEYIFRKYVHLDIFFEQNLKLKSIFFAHIDSIEILIKHKNPKHCKEYQKEKKFYT